MSSPQSQPSMDDILASIRRIISEEDDAPETPRRRPAPLKLEESAAVDLGVLDEEPGDEPDLSAAAEEEEGADHALDASAGAGADAEASEPDADDDIAAAGEAMAKAVTPAPDEEDDLQNYTPEEEPSVSQPQTAARQSAETETPAEAPAVNGRNTLGGASSVESLAEAAAKRLVGEGTAAKASEAFGALEHNVRVSNGNGRTIEDLVEAMLAPMIQAWLDENLPRIVEDKVEDEVRRIARRR